MAKLSFRQGAMGSSKSASAMICVYNYRERGMTALLLKPECEDRDGKMSVKSRIGLEMEADDTVEHFLKRVKEDDKDLNRIDAIVVDEAQFLSPETVDGLSDIVDFYNIPVVCYGLRTDFQAKAFPGSARLLEIADAIEEVPTICWCGHKARFNARIVDGKVIKTGEQVQLGGSESYVALCRKHFKLGQLGPEEAGPHLSS